MSKLRIPTNYIGFDTLEDSIKEAFGLSQKSYPPYNIVKLSDKETLIEVAIAGFSLEDITIELHNNVLSIKGNREVRHDPKLYAYQGISTKKFTKDFKLRDNVKVVSAKAETGLLIISLETEVKEVAPTKIKIEGSL